MRSEVEILIVEDDPVVAAYLDDVIADTGMASGWVSLPSGLRELLVSDPAAVVVGLDGQALFVPVALRVLSRRRIPVVLYTAAADQGAWAAQFPGIPIFCNNPPRDRKLARHIQSAVDAAPSDRFG